MNGSKTSGYNQKYSNDQDYSTQSSEESEDIQMSNVRNNNKEVTDHIKTKHRIQDLRYDDFNSLIQSCMMSDEDRDILRMIYCENKNLAYIGDMLGYSESTIKTKHRKLLKKLMKLL